MKKILVVKNRAIGDSLIGLAVCQYLRSVIGDSFISYGVPKWIRPFYSVVHGDYDEIIPVDLKNFFRWPSFYRKLLNNKYDAIFELHQSGRTGKFFNLFSKTSRVPYFFHNHHKKEKTYVYGQGITAPSIQRDLDGVWSALKLLKEYQDLERPSYLDYTPKLKINDIYQENHFYNSKIIILGLPASRQSKRWPTHFYLELMTLILKDHPDCKFKIFLSHSKLDQELKKEILETKMSSFVNIIEGPLSELPKLFSRCSLYIGNDSGQKHMAVALGLKTCTFFGPEGPAEWHPYNEDQHLYFFKEKIDCRYNNSHFCGLAHCSHRKCLCGIRPEHVYAKLIQKGLLNF